MRWPLKYERGGGSLACLSSKGAFVGDGVCNLFFMGSKTPGVSQRETGGCVSSEIHAHKESGFPCTRFPEAPGRFHGNHAPPKPVGPS